MPREIVVQWGDKIVAECPCPAPVWYEVVVKGHLSARARAHLVVVVGRNAHGHLIDGEGFPVLEGITRLADAADHYWMPGPDGAVRHLFRDRAVAEAFEADQVEFEMSYVGPEFWATAKAD